jgi:hypothetical protein
VGSNVKVISEKVIERNEEGSVRGLVVFITRRSQNLSGKPDEASFGSERTFSLRQRFVSDSIYFRAGRRCRTNQQNCGF